MDRYYWKIEYLPAVIRPTIVGWVFYGSEEELNELLNKKFSCHCEQCEGKDWWESNESCEYEVTKLENFNA